MQSNGEFVKILPLTKRYWVSKVTTNFVVKLCP